MKPETKSEKVTIRLTPTEKALLQERALRNNITLSALLYQIIFTNKENFNESL